jgi:hypothetical protein
LIDDLGEVGAKKSHWKTSEKKMKKALDSLGEGADRATSGVLFSRIQIDASVRLPLFEARKWLPPTFTAAGYMPDQQNELGAPCIFRQIPGTVRHSHFSMAWDGMARFIVGTRQCNFVVFAWPSSELLDLGGTCSNTLRFLDNLTKEHFRKFADKHFWTCPVVEGTVVWIPVGWSVAMVALKPIHNAADSNPESNRFSYAYSFPMVNETLYRKMSQVNIDQFARY